MAKVREIVHEEVDLHAGISSACTGLFNRGFGIVHAGHIETMLGEINGVRPGAAPQVNGAAWFDAPTFHQRCEFLPRPDVPRCPEKAVCDFIELFHWCRPDIMVSMEKSKMSRVRNTGNLA